MKILFFIMCFFLFGCFKEEKIQISFEELDYRMTKEWIYASSIKMFVPESQVITRPPGLEQLLFKLEIPESGGLDKKSHCIYYTVGFKQKKSSLVVNEYKGVDDCPVVSDSENTFLKTTEIDQVELKVINFELHFSFTYLGQKRLIKIPLVNIEGSKEHSKLKPMTTKSYHQGLKLLKLNDDSFDFSLNKNLGKIADRFSLGTAIRCHQVDKNCQDIGENRCLDCKYGWYEVVDFQCPQGGSKFCGQNHCGEKNEPACPRGVKVVDIIEAGICQSDLEPVSNGDKILVCQ